MEENKNDFNEIYKGITRIIKTKNLQIGKKKEKEKNGRRMVCRNWQHNCFTRNI
jgi:hypothetical protein